MITTSLQHADTPGSSITTRDRSAYDHLTKRDGGTEVKAQMRKPTTDQSHGKTGHSHVASVLGFPTIPFAGLTVVSPRWSQRFLAESEFSFGKHYPCPPCFFTDAESFSKTKTTVTTPPQNPETAESSIYDESSLPLLPLVRWRPCRGHFSLRLCELSFP